MRKFNLSLSAIVLGLVLSAVSCARAQTSVGELTEAERYQLAADYSRDNRGVSVLVVKGDRVVFEDYQNGHRADQSWFLASGTKSFSGVMACAAIEDRLIRDFDEPVSATITEWRDDAQKSKITLRQLLSLTSGIDAGQIGRVPTYGEAINFPVKYDAGTKFEYGPVPFQIFGEVMRRKLAAQNETVMDYLKRRILDPIGLQVGFWRMPNGEPLLPQGASLTAREWAKFGQLLKNGGSWQGKPVVRKQLLDELFQGSAANPAYGVTFWLNRAGTNAQGRLSPPRAGAESPNLTAESLQDVYMAAGAGNQRLYVVPSKDLVIVRQGNFGEFSDREFLRMLIFGKK